MNGIETLCILLWLLEEITPSELCIEFCVDDMKDEKLVAKIGVAILDMMPEYWCLLELFSTVLTPCLPSERGRGASQRDPLCIFLDYLQSAGQLSND